MENLPVTLVTASFLGLIFIWLSVRVIAVRVSGEVSIGDGGNTDLHYKIRAHGNFSEYVPLFLIILGALELAGANQIALIIFGDLFILSRISHVFGMGEHAKIAFRQLGTVGSFACIIGTSLYGLYLGLTQLG